MSPPEDTPRATQTSDDHQLFAYQIRELQRALRDIGEQMGQGFERLEKKLDEHRQEQAVEIQLLRDRVRTLEVRQGGILFGMGLVFTAIAGTIWKVLTAGSGF